MLNLDTVDIVYIACGVTDLRKSIDELILEVESNLKLDPFEKALSSSAILPSLWGRLLKKMGIYHNNKMAVLFSLLQFL